MVYNKSMDISIYVYALLVPVFILVFGVLAIYYFVKAKYMSHILREQALIDQEAAYSQGYLNHQAGMQNAFNSWIGTHMGLDIAKAEDGYNAFQRMYGLDRQSQTSPEEDQ